MKERLIINTLNKKAQIDYPCHWLYKVIGGEPQELQVAIEEILAGEQYRCSLSNTSSTGKYHCFNVEVRVSDEAHRNRLFQQLKAHQAVTMVL